MAEINFGKKTVTLHAGEGERELTSALRFADVATSKKHPWKVVKETLADTPLVIDTSEDGCPFLSCATID